MRHGGHRCPQRCPALGLEQPTGSFLLCSGGSLASRGDFLFSKSGLKVSKFSGVLREQRAELRIHEYTEIFRSNLLPLDRSL